MPIRSYPLILLVLAISFSIVSAEVPPLEKEKLESGASLIVTGKVTDVKVGEAR